MWGVGTKIHELNSANSLHPKGIVNVYVTVLACPDRRGILNKNEYGMLKIACLTLSRILNGQQLRLRSAHRMADRSNKDQDARVVKTDRGSSGRHVSKCTAYCNCSKLLCVLVQGCWLGPFVCWHKAFVLMQGGRRSLGECECQQSWFHAALVERRSFICPCFSYDTVCACVPVGRYPGTYHSGGDQVPFRVE